jgi:excisionase family DNA binding protein
MMYQILQKGGFVVDINEAYQLIFKDYPDVLGVKDVIQMLGIGKPKVYKLIHEGKLKVIPCGRYFRIAKISLLQYLLGLDEDAA